ADGSRAGHRDERAPARQRQRRADRREPERGFGHASLASRAGRRRYQRATAVLEPGAGARDAAAAPAARLLPRADRREDRRGHPLGAHALLPASGGARSKGRDQQLGDQPVWHRGERCPAGERPRRPLSHGAASQRRISAPYPTAEARRRAAPIERFDDATARDGRRATPEATLPGSTFLGPALRRRPERSAWRSEAADLRRIALQHEAPVHVAARAGAGALGAVEAGVAHDEVAARA